MRIRRRWVAIGALLLVGCAGQTGLEREGAAYGVTQGVFHGRWWNYYERGVSYGEGQFFAEAEADLQKALQGRSADTWAARTYGMHFVPYFPNRELGVVCYHQDRLDDAERYLRASLEQADSERARHYLDLITKRRIEQGILSDGAAPALTSSIFGMGSDMHIVADRIVPVRVEVEDDLGVAGLSVNGAPIGIRGNTDAFEYKSSLALPEGTHAIAISASDLAGKETEAEMNIVVDLTGPAIAILDPAPPLVTTAFSLRLRGAAADANGVAEVRLGDTVLAQSAGAAQLEFTSDLPLVAGENHFVLAARDMAGNETFAPVDVLCGEPHAAVSRRWLEQARGEAGVQVASAVDAIPGLLAGAAEEQQGPLSIHMKFPNARVDTASYRKNELRVAGWVAAEVDLRSFAIQGDSFPVVPGAKRVDFSRRIPIEAHETKELHVAAEDTQGRKEEWSAKITGKPVMLDEYRMKVAVQYVQGGDEAVESYLQSMLVSKLASVEEGRFEVLERAQLEAVLQELQLSTSDLADPRFASKLGKVKPADVFLFAEAYPREAGGIELLVRAIGADNGLVLDTYDVFVGDWNDADQREERVNEIAGWMARTFPRVPGAVDRVAGNNAWVNLGVEEGIRKGMKVVLAYEAAPEERDPATGEVLEDALYDAMGWAPIDGVDAERSKLGPLAPALNHEDATIAEGQPVFTM